MDFQVEITTRANMDILEALVWMRRHPLEYVERWHDGLREAIDSLKTFPRRCPVAQNFEDYPGEVRLLLYGKKPNVYRILFTIHGDKVEVIHIRHGARARS